MARQYPKRFAGKELYPCGIFGREVGGNTFLCGLHAFVGFASTHVFVFVSENIAALYGLFANRGAIVVAVAQYRAVDFFQFFDHIFDNDTGRVFFGDIYFGDEFFTIIGMRDTYARS